MASPLSKASIKSVESLDSLMMAVIPIESACRWKSYRRLRPSCDVPERRTGSLGQTDSSPSRRAAQGRFVQDMRAALFAAVAAVLSSVASAYPPGPESSESGFIKINGERFRLAHSRVHSASICVLASASCTLHCAVAVKSCLRRPCAAAYRHARRQPLLLVLRVSR